MNPLRTGRPSSRWLADARGLVLGLALLASPVVTVAAPPSALGPPEPQLPEPATPPEPERSYIPARMWVSLRPAIVRLEQAVPPAIGTSGRFEREEEGVEVCYRMVRGPLELTARDDTLFVRARVAYWLSARGKEFTELVCGSEGEPLIAWIGCMVLIGWDDAWGLDSRTVLLPITHERRCKPKPPGIDFTEMMTGKIEEHLMRPLAGAIRKSLGEEILLRPRVAAVWEALRDPVEIGRGGERWLDYGIRRMLAGPLVASGDSLRLDIAAEMRPHLVTSMSSPTPGPLGDPCARLIGDQLQVAFDCTVSLDSLAIRIQERCGRAPDEAPAAVQVSAVAVRGGGDKLAVSLETRGRLSGRVHLVGRVRYDERTHAMSVEGLDYSSETLTALRGQSAEVLQALRGIRDRVEVALDVDMSGQVVAAASPIGRAVNRDLSQRVSISGGMNQRRLLGIVVTDRAVVARLVAIGRTWLTVR